MVLLYHAESKQEAFLVLSGECALLVEDEERRLRPWDFFHSSPWTEHAQRVTYRVASGKEIELERSSFDLVVFSWSL
jgi:hypothetical protein